MTTLRRIVAEPLPELPPLRATPPALRMPYAPSTLAALALAFGLVTLAHAILQSETVRLLLEGWG